VDALDYPTASIFEDFWIIFSFWFTYSAQVFVYPSTYVHAWFVQGEINASSRLSHTSNRDQYGFLDYYVTGTVTIAVFEKSFLIKYTKILKWRDKLQSRRIVVLSVSQIIFSNRGTVWLKSVLFRQKNYLGFKKNFNFFRRKLANSPKMGKIAENRQKSPKIVIITLTPGWTQGTASWLKQVNTSPF
jgi:hypothetical protein